jgi:hypothetical protein
LTQTRPRPEAGSETTGVRPPARRRRLLSPQAIAWVFLGVFTGLAVAGYQLIPEAASWAVGFGVSVALLEVGLIGFCLIADRDS